MPSPDNAPNDETAESPETDDTPPMRTVDLRNAPGTPDDGTPPTSDEAPAESADADEAGVAEAKRVYEAADGATEREKLTNAIADLRESFQSLATQRQEAHQRRQQLTTQREQFDATREHLQTLVDDGDDRRVTREWAGGITTEVPHDDLPELIETVDERHDSLGDELAQVDDRLEQLEHGAEKAQAALEWLQRKQAAFDEVDDLTATLGE